MNCQVSGCRWRRGSATLLDTEGAAGKWQPNQNCSPPHASEATSCLASFTMIELLVVIGSIGILAAMLISAISPAKRKTQSVHCQSNLHQIGVAMQMYLHDAGVYPYTLSFPENSDRGISSWFDTLSFGLAKTKWGEGVFKCPAYEGISYGGETSFDRRGELACVYAPCGSYAYNAAGRRRPSLRPSGLISAGLGHTVYSGRALEQPVREADVSAPADLYAVGDSPLATAVWGPKPKPRLGGAADYNSLAANSAVIQKARHTAAFNMLLTDGHVEGVRTNVLLGAHENQLRRWNHDHRP